MLTFLALSFANADSTEAIMDLVVDQQSALQIMEAELEKLRTECADGCSVIAPAPKPKATKRTKSAPKPVAAPVPDPRIAALEAEITELRLLIAALPTEPPVINITVPAAPPPDVFINPTVVEHTREIVRATGTRFHIGLSEVGTVAPPLPGESSWVTDRTEIFGRYEWAVGGKTWVGLEVDAGYGFLADSSSLRALPTFTVNLAEITDFNVGVGASYLCESAFTGGPLCSATRTGGQVQIGIAQQVGPVALEAFVGGGYDMVDSSSDGIGGVSYGYGGLRAFFGPVGRDSSVTVR